MHEVFCCFIKWKSGKLDHRFFLNKKEACAYGKTISNKSNKDCSYFNDVVDAVMISKMIADRGPDES